MTNRKSCLLEWSKLHWYYRRLMQKSYLLKHSQLQQGYRRSSTRVVSCSSLSSCYRRLTQKSCLLEQSYCSSSTICCWSSLCFSRAKKEQPGRVGCWRVLVSVELQHTDTEELFIPAITAVVKLQINLKELFIGELSAPVKEQKRLTQKSSLLAQSQLHR